MDAINLRKFLSVALWVPAAACFASERPNILWITSEDNAASWLGCYGNAEAHTPRLDALAAQGLRFTAAYSNAPVCAVARSTILTGAHAPAMGTQHMRSRHPIPATFRPYVTVLREAGYYCTNNAKTDYNFRVNDASLWDESSGKAHYRNRPADKPFFAIFNLTVSHESSLFPPKIAAHRKQGLIPAKPRLDPATVTLAPYLPDLPEIRSDTAIYHDTVTALDRQVGRLLDELDKAGLADDTIVFYYSDHGGILPRGKRYLEDSGTRVPLLVRMPEKWRHLSPFAAGGVVDECVSFVDLSPTLLSLAGVENFPPRLQGRAFLGARRTEPPPDDVVFLYGDRFDEIYGMRRGITDGRWKYIRCFTPSLPAAPYSYYQFDQAGWKAWRAAWQDGSLDPRFGALWEAPQPVERLFDTAADPHEVRDLAGDPVHAERLAAMRARLEAEMIRHADTGIVPEPMFASLCGDQTVADFVAARKAELPALVKLAFTASAPRPADLDTLIAGLAADDPLTRYWSAQGCRNLGQAANSAAAAITTLAADPHSANRIAAATAFDAIGEAGRARELALAELERATTEPAALDAIQTLTRFDALGTIPDEWIERTLANPKSGEYPNRLAGRLRAERSRPR